MNLQYWRKLQAMSQTNFNQDTPVLSESAAATTGVTSWVGIQMKRLRTMCGLGYDETGGRPQSKSSSRSGKQTGKIAFFWITIVFLAGTASASTVFIPGVHDPGRPNASNPFDYTNITITSNSATFAGSDVRDIFGGTFSTMEAPGRTVFADNPNVVTAYQVSFTTSAPVSISGFSLFLKEDSTATDLRSATDFQLKANGNLITDAVIGSPGQSYFVNFGSDFLEVSATFAPVTASSFQAIFTSNNSAFNGIRVYELDAQAVAVPEPTTIRLALLSGLVLVAFVRRRKTVR
jgi:PEP-CTERM motif